MLTTLDKLARPDLCGPSSSPRPHAPHSSGGGEPRSGKRGWESGSWGWAAPPRSRDVHPSQRGPLSGVRVPGEPFTSQGPEQDDAGGGPHLRRGGGGPAGATRMRAARVAPSACRITQTEVPFGASPAL